MPKARLFLSVVVGATLATAVGVYAYGASGGGENLPPAFDVAHSDLTPAQARAFDNFTLYSAGESFEGLPLVGITRRLDPPASLSDVPLPSRANFANFIYGDCKAESDSGCAPPLQIQVWPACERTLSSYSLTPAGDPLPHDDTTVRGVPAAFFEEGGRLEVYTGEVTIVLFGQDRGQLLRAAAALRAENGGVGPDAKLPAPAAGALEGKLEC